MKNLLLVFAFAFFSMAKAQVPVANFTVSPALLCSGSPIQVTDLSTNAPTAWSYTFSGGAPATSTLQNPSVTFAAGVHTITLVASNGSGTSTPVVQTITVVTGANFAINPSTKNMCIGGGPVTFTATTAGPGPALTYSWTTGATTASVSVSPGVTTTYSCVATATNGCTRTHTAMAVVNPQPTVAIIANPAGICPGGTSTLSAISSTPGPYTYSWSTAATTGAISTTLTGVYSVTVTNGAGVGCVGSQSYTLGSATSISINATAAPIAICLAGSSTLSATGATSYTWSNLATTPTTAVSPTTSTTYTVFGVNGTCTASASVFVLVNAGTPTVIASASPATICAGNSTTLSATGANTYTWIPGPIVGPVAVVSPGANITYSVIGKNGCGANTTTAMVTVNAAPVVTAYSSASVICSGDPVILTASTAATSYTWNTGSNSMSITVTPASTTNYTVSVSGPNGCIGTNSITQNVSPCTGIAVNSANRAKAEIYPNPNNGEFLLATEILSGELIIVDALGKVVYKKNLNENQTKINLTGFNEGIYYLRINNGNTVISKKLLIEK